MTMSLMRATNKIVEGRVIRMAERPLTFDQFLDMAYEDDDLELVKEVLVKRMAAQYPRNGLSQYRCYRDRLCGCAQTPPAGPAPP